MQKRRQIAFGMAGGLVWGVAVLWLSQVADLPFIPLPLAIPLSLVAPGLVLAAMIGVLAARRYFDESIIDGTAFSIGSKADIDQRVLTNTIEQSVLALLLWPLVSLTMGAGAVIALGLSFALMRVLFWIGYHRAPQLRALGFAGTFYPTVMAGVWSIALWAV